MFRKSPANGHLRNVKTAQICAHGDHAAVCFFLRWLSGMHLEPDLRYPNPNFRDLLQTRCPNEPGVPEVPVRYGESAI